jgi:drug/metabolite transporter (DMT)-like permease
VQPVGAVLLAMVLISEDPSALQLAGVAVVLGGIFVAVSGRDRPQPAG